MKETHCNNPSCGKELEHTEGRRPKKYCTPKCRISHHIQQKKQPKFVRLETHNKLKKDYEELKSKIDFTPSTENCYDGNQISRSYVGDELPQFITGDPKEKMEIYQKIAAIRAEKIPDYRNTSLGKKVWQKEQDDKIRELQKKLNPPI